MFGVDIRNRCTVVRVDNTVFIDIDNFELSQSEVRAGVSVDDFGIIVVSSVADIAVLDTYRHSYSEQDITGNFGINPSVVELLVLSLVQ